MAGVGVPIKLIQEAQGLVVTIELKTGELYRGTLVESEDNMNCQMSNVTLTARDGRVTNLEQGYIRGSHIRFFILPDMLKNAPMFRRQEGAKGMGRGRTAQVRHKAAATRGGGGRGRF
eukprot:GCRY01000404.1.p1 GENE.GCRY01000404.1~~GCRY01000404.1.p1  ORF type:complete len:131 (+),score=9.84 GCRY01000404.1:41-394(+)